MLIDTHSHIYLPEFDNDRALMLERAGGEGISKILMPAIDSSTHEAMLRLEKDNSATCLSMMGIHPCSVKENPDNELKIAREHLEKRSFIAIGETGLDFYWDKTFVEQPYRAFHEQIEGSERSAGLHARYLPHFGRRFQVLEQVGFIHEQMIDAQILESQAGVLALLV